MRSIQEAEGDTGLITTDVLKKKLNDNNVAVEVGVNISQY